MKSISQLIVAVAFARSFCTVSASVDSIAEAKDESPALFLATRQADSLARFMSDSDEDLPGNALAKVLRMVNRLKLKINNETELGEEMNRNYKKWCTKSLADAKNEADYHEGLMDKYYADLQQSSADIRAAQDEIDRLNMELMTTQSMLRREAERRAKEKAEYEQGMKDLKDSIKAITHAIDILEGEIQKNPELIQKISMQSLDATLSAFGTIMDAASFPYKDKSMLVAMMQENQQDHQEEAEDETDSQDPAAYKKRSGTITNLLIDMKQKALKQQSEMRDDEIKAEGEYRMLELSLKDNEAKQKKALDEQKKVKSTALKTHAESEALYNRAKADFDHNKELQSKTEKDCDDWGKDHKRFIEEQAKEIKLLDDCIAAINDATKSVGGVQDMTSAGDMSSASAIQESSQASDVPATTFLQESLPGMNLVKSQVVGMVKGLANKYHNLALAQLASRMKIVLRYDSADERDPFYKVKALIKDMIAKLEDQLGEDQSEKKFCDNEMSSTKAKLTELGIDIEKLDRLHEMSYMQEMDIQEWLRRVQEAIAEDAKAEAEAQKNFNANQRNYYITRENLVDALEAVRKAITMLSKFYGEPERADGEAGSSRQDMEARGEAQHDETMAMSSNAGASSFLQEATADASTATKNTLQGHGIIDMLRMIEEDLAHSLELEDEMFSEAKVDYQEVMLEYTKNRKLHSQDKMYGDREYSTQRRSTSEVEQDEESALTEKEQVSVYYLKLRDRCIARPERFDDRKRARDEEIKGLRAALDILREETSYLQKEGEGQRLRGLRRSRQQLDEIAMRA